MSTIDAARAELTRLVRMLESQQKLVDVMEQTHERFPPHVSVVTLPAGTLRKLFVNRKCAAQLEPPIMVEDDKGKRWYARHVKAITPLGEWGEAFEFKWTGSNDVAPALWIETTAQLRLTL